MRLVELLDNKPRLASCYFYSNIARESAELSTLEVKRKALSKTPEKKTLVQSLKSEVLAQIGAELLAELPYSVFSNRSVGILCMRTEIVFMMLDMSQTESQAIKVGSDIVNRKGKVMYTRSYDILKADDRQEVMGFLLWLAFVQKGNIKEFYGMKHSV
ncbi:hypothetical protein FSP39_002390 [Pinctada imbricata]|uniref:Uncharacterized protein n=1 Tax=Pinctada imbricata TaxID=66713 RepID=A0AA88XKS5_PINIB|nr:hypothetical protein FSP39_002390 [Pinctada imbricata]